MLNDSDSENSISIAERVHHNKSRKQLENNGYSSIGATKKLTTDYNNFSKHIPMTLNKLN